MHKNDVRWGCFLISWPQNVKNSFLVEGGKCKPLTYVPERRKGSVRSIKYSEYLPATVRLKYFRVFVVNKSVLKAIWLALPIRRWTGGKTFAMLRTSLVLSKWYGPQVHRPQVLSPRESNFSPLMELSSRDAYVKSSIESYWQQKYSDMKG